MRDLQALVVRLGLIVWVIVFAPAALVSSSDLIELPRSSGRVFDGPLLVVSFGLAGVAIWILQLEYIGPIAAPLVLSLSYGGVPYVIGGLGLFFWMRGKRGSEIGRISYWVPLLLLPLLWTPGSAGRYRSPNSLRM